MNRRLLPMGIMLLLTVIAGAELALAWTHLPVKMATHFASDGTPNGWSSKASFATLMLVMLAVIDAMFFGMAWIIPRIPDALVNMPRKDYWLTPERRAATHASLVIGLSWLGAATIGLMVWLNHETIAANLSATVELATGGWLPMGAYTVYIIGWLIVFVGHFYRTPRDEAPDGAAGSDIDDAE